MKSATAASNYLSMSLFLIERALYEKKKKPSSDRRKVASISNILPVCAATGGWWGISVY